MKGFPVRTPLLFALIVTSVATLSHASSAEATRPNVLFIAVDDLRPELGCYDQGHIRSPHIDRLATQSVRFDWAYCMVPTCGAWLDHGWDIDLDDGSSNYRVYNNLMLSGGLKFREGFSRVAENNIMANNSFHPHVWYTNSGDVVRNNIVFTKYQPIRVPVPWGSEVDRNLLHQPGVANPTAATVLAKQSGRDEHSIIADDPGGQETVAGLRPCLRKRPKWRHLQIVTWQHAIDQKHHDRDIQPERQPRASAVCRHGIECRERSRLGFERPFGVSAAWRSRYDESGCHNVSGHGNLVERR
jgi:hypothetical protein